MPCSIYRNYNFPLNFVLIEKYLENTWHFILTGIDRCFKSFFIEIKDFMKSYYSNKIELVESNLYVASQPSRCLLIID